MNKHFLALAGFFLFLFQACQNPSSMEEEVIDTEEPSNEEPSGIEAAFNIEIMDAEGAKVISESAKIEVIAEGHEWTEGPIYVAEGDYLLYSDIPKNKIFKWKEGEGKSLYLEPAGTTGILERKNPVGSNGLLLNAQNQLVLCQHGDRRMAVCTAPLSDIKPEYKTLADKYDGKQLNSPNDADFHSNGDLYFTDPPYGLDNGLEDENKELDFQGIYRLKPDGHLDLLSTDLKFPNGIVLSQDEKKLYVANSEPSRCIWMVFDVDSEGMAQNGSVFYDATPDEEKYKGKPDGMKINQQGIIFATGPGGVWIFDENATVLARVYTGQATSNCALSADEKMLYLTADDYVLRVPLL